MSDQNINNNNNIGTTVGEFTTVAALAALERRYDSLLARFEAQAFERREEVLKHSQAMNLVHDVLLSLTEDDPDLLDDERIQTLVADYGLPSFDVEITVEFVVKGSITVTAPRGTTKEDVAEDVAASLQELVEGFEADSYDDTDVTVSSVDMDDWRY